MEDTDRSSHKQILKATSIVGGSKIIQVVIRIIRNKIIAVLLGPAGVGISGLYYSTLELVKSATGLGLSFSAVRDVAEANGTGDQERIGRTIKILRRWVWFTGIFGLAAVIVFHGLFSQYAFNDSAHKFQFLLLSIVPLFNALSGGQMALLRGIRRIKEMALASVLGAGAGLVITVPLYWLWGVDGIVPALILSALAQLCLSLYFARQVKVAHVKVDLRETITGGAGMIKLGLFTVVTGLATTGTMYLVRIFISQKTGVEGVGQFQAAWNLSATYVGLVLSAMAADYFPHLSAVNKDNKLVRRLVNEQTEVALILAGPIVVGMVCFIDLIVFLFYSDKFTGSIDILLWQTMGNLLKVISWPMGFILLAKGRGGWYIFTELLSNMLLLGTIFFGWGKYGLESVGIAFVVMYIGSTSVVLFVSRRLCGFIWSKRNAGMILSYMSLTILAFINIRLKLFPFWRIFSFMLLASALIVSYNRLRDIIDIKKELRKIMGGCKRKME
ncbi:O-antigen translocase [Marispirochaeta aestuarii]|uniref:O-antigen translocase n=1 Tax=Marispirochaeta aestuarii TaxID=1963862 RepID=UPI002ABD9FA7|nr:O-antigen translocase [Marispirochaeta aestuarii]